jgi:hypothetical protein
MWCRNRVGRAAGFTIIAAAIVAAGAAPALAQGFYYKEIRKDDRIYVFNVAANAERFETSGEMGVGITRPGAGPNGETVVGDNERALQLFFFKYGISEPVPDPPAPPPPAPPYRFSGLVFGDYYYFSDQHDAKWEGQQGFWLRRLYFTFDYTFTPRVTTRFRLEANSNGKLAGGSLTPYVKDAYLRWTFYGRQQVTIGIQPSLSFDYVESIWGLRHIEKTPLDLYRWDSSRDTGVTVAGPLNDANTLKYNVQFGNESGNNAETDKFKAIRASARYEANPGFTLEGMYAYFARDRDADRTTAQVFTAYRAKKARAGFQYSYQRRNAASGTTAPVLELDIYSGFAVADLKPQKLSLFARIDRYNDPCPDCSGIDYLPIDTAAKFTMFLVGVEYYLIPSVRFSPNVEWVSYGTPENGGAPAPKDDVVWRATFYWVW